MSLRWRTGEGASSEFVRLRRREPGAIAAWGSTETVLGLSGSEGGWEASSWAKADPNANTKRGRFRLHVLVAIAVLTDALTRERFRTLAGTCNQILNITHHRPLFVVVVVGHGGDFESTLAESVMR